MRTLSAFVRNAAHRMIGRFAADRAGVSAVEFALILPLMITLYLGGIEVSTAVAVDRKTTLVAHTVADLAAQSSNITDSMISDILDASAAVSSPYSTTPLMVRVSSIIIDSTGVAKIAWSQARGGTANAEGTTVTLPTALKVAKTSLIWGEVTYSYTPMFGTIFKSNLTLGDAIYMRPRISNAVCRNGAKCTIS